MANIPIWNGTSTFYPGDTPFGFYDNDYQFQQDADRVAKFCASRLGYPISEVELQSGSIYTAFEEAVTVYGNELYAFKLRDNMLSFEGLSTGSSVNNALVTPTMDSVVRLAQQYGEEAGVGGNVDYNLGFITLESGIQDYDLADWAVSQSISGGIEIKRIFYQEAPAIDELYSPYAGLGAGFGFDAQAAALGSIGLGYGPGLNFLLMPLSYDMQTIQAIEMSNQIRQANYSFQLINNKLRIFPVPGDSDVGEGGYRQYLWFEYINKEDRTNSAVTDSPTKVTNESNAPYNNPTYSSINSIGRSWVFEYTLALSKEVLGNIRNKYSTVPIPGSEVTLNGADLVSQGQTEREALIARLREYFESTSRQALLERRQAESTALQSEIGQVPMQIYIG